MSIIYSILSMALEKSDLTYEKQSEIFKNFRSIHIRYDERERRRNRLVKLRRQGYTQKEIATILKMSLRDVNQICMEGNLVRGRRK
ncbi:MAG: hypothetical protein RLZZ104_1967 [Pseudomonadota bacterium]|jgi:DNA-binding NarL/FixJ family response regulator